MKRPVTNPKSAPGRRPWIPLYVDDHLAETSSLSPTEHSAYVLLLLNYWRDGGLPSDHAKLARIARLTPKEWRNAEPALAPLFGPGWSNANLDTQIQRAKEISDKKRAAVAVREERRFTIVASNDPSCDASRDPACDDRLQTPDFKRGSKPGERHSVGGSSRGGRAGPDAGSGHDGEDVFNARGIA